jgi:hypothetical protein
MTHDANRGQKSSLIFVLPVFGDSSGKVQDTVCIPRLKVVLHYVVVLQVVDSRVELL